MKVKLERALHVVRPGEIFPEWIPAGAIVEGRVAEIAIEQKKGSRIDAEAFSIEIGADGTVKGVVVLDPDAHVRNPQGVTVQINDNGHATGVTLDGVHPLSSAPMSDARPSLPSTTRARVKKAYAGPDDIGKPCKLAKGAIIEGAFADALIASGFAAAL